ncbi:unnamed protein product [Peronospora effusa]|nr:unnamed protein product [Peronospora effusa]
MPITLSIMEDSHHFASSLSPDSFDSDSLSGLHTTWMDDEQLNNLLIMDVFSDVPMSRPQNSSTDCFNIAEKSMEQSNAIDSVLYTELGDHESQLLNAALDVPADRKHSPFLESFADTTVATSPLKMQTRHCRSPRTRRTTSSALSRTETGTRLQRISKKESNETKEPTTLLSDTMRPRTRSSLWQKHEQNTFFALFKVKWPPTPKSKPLPPFSSLLLQRFDAISTKIRTKSVMEVKQFYTMVLQNIYELLEVVDNDVDLTNPDQVRIAVWCWSKLIADKKHYDEFRGLASEPAAVKANLANVLLQSIIRSRRQMLKAKSENLTLNSNAPAPGLTSISAWVSRSNLSSFFARPDVPVSEASTVQIHYPMVRKKHSASMGQVAVMSSARAASVFDNAKKVLSLPNELPGGATVERKRSVFTDHSPVIASVKTHQSGIGSATFTSPAPMEKRSRSRTQNEILFHTPQKMSRKKIYIKMRMVPRDKQTKADLVRCGCRPKVELKLSSTKKVSEITAHMSKKWAKVRPLLPKEAVLCFFQKRGTDKWSKEDPNVTCFDIWKLSGKQTNDENVVEVSYVWMVPEKMTTFADDPNVQAQDLMPLSFQSGFYSEKLYSPTKQAISNGDESETDQFSPALGLQEFSETAAFDRSVTAEANEEAAAIEAMISDSCDEDLGEEFRLARGCLRRRIKPVLLSKEEFNI